jgi:Coenzyme PQQ synthesis protein D (PqqD)
MTRLHPAPGVGTVDHGDTVYAARLPDGPIVVLDGVAALIWTEACAGDRESIAERVAEATDAAPDAIRTDVEAFVADLLTRGLLE